MAKRRGRRTCNNYYNNNTEVPSPPAADSHERPNPLNPQTPMVPHHLQKAYRGLFHHLRNITEDLRNDLNALAATDETSEIKELIKKEIEEDWEEHHQQLRRYWYRRHTLYSDHESGGATADDDVVGVVTNETHNDESEVTVTGTAAAAAASKTGEQTRFALRPKQDAAATYKNGQILKLDELATEVLCEIFSHLSYAELTKEGRILCHRFNTIICDPSNCISSMPRCKRLPIATPREPTTFWKVWRQYMDPYASNWKKFNIDENVKFRYKLHHGLSSLMVDVGILKDRELSMEDVMFLKSCKVKKEMVVVPCPRFWYGENAFNPARGVVRVTCELCTKDKDVFTPNYIVRGDDMGMDVHGCVEGLLYILNKNKDKVLEGLEEKNSKSKRLGKVTGYRLLLGDCFDFEMDKIDRSSLLCKVKGKDWVEKGVAVYGGSVRVVEDKKRLN